MTPAGIATLHVATTGSTNSDLLASAQSAAAAGAPFAPCLLVAGVQTAGRGRHGRPWQGAAGASLTFSLAWPFAATTELGALSLAVGVALAEALDPAPAGADAATATAGRIGLKWPNDLWLMDAAAPVGGDGGGAGRGGRKLGGVLIEVAPCGEGRVAVIGVGLNVAEQAVADAASGIAWLAELDAAATPASVLARVAPALVDAVRRFEARGFAAFAAGFAARDVLLGRPVAGDAGAVAGVAIGVSADGELLLRSGDGTIAAVRSGEVPAQAAGAAGGAAVLRTLLAALLVANLLFFGFTRGWFDGALGLRSLGDREPERLAAQVRPEAVHIVAAGAASTAAPASCFEAGPFSAAEAVGAEAELKAALPAGSWLDLRSEAANAAGGESHTYRVVAADAALAARLATVRLDAAGRTFSLCAAAARPR